MRWNGLFDDLEAHWADLGWQETVAEAAELTRAEWMALSLADRLRGARGRQVRLHLAWGEVVDGVVHTVGQGWVGVHVDGSGSAIVAVDCVAAVEADLTRAVAAPELAAAGWGTVLRGIARTRQPVWAAAATRMKYSPWPVQETATPSSAQVPAAGMGVSPTRPGILPNTPAVEVAAASRPAMSSTQQPTVPWLSPPGGWLSSP